MYLRADPSYWYSVVLSDESGKYRDDDDDAGKYRLAVAHTGERLMIQ